MSNILKTIKRFISRNDQQVRPGGNVADVSPVQKETAVNPIAPQRLSQAPLKEIKTNYLAFDLEIAKHVPGDFNNWQSYRPLGISCAATVCDGIAPMLWYSKNPDGSIASKLSETDCYQLVAYLHRAIQKGWKIVTWNGLGFDFQILAEESHIWSSCIELALGHIDMMFHLFCIKGYPIALNKAALGMKLPGKLEGVTGEMAPILWQQGQYEKVFRYVEQDVQTTLDVAKAGLYYHKISWTSNSGTNQSVDLSDGWLPVEEVMSLPKPDTSWMRSPIERSEFFQWIFDYRLEMEEYDRQAERNGYVADVVPIQPEHLQTISPTKETELSENEINRQFAQYDRAWETGPIPQTHPAKRVDEVYSSVSVCPCPICRGEPNLDFRFRLDEEDNGYWEERDYWNRDEDDY